MAGMTVSKGEFDTKVAQAVISLRNALEQADTIFNFLANNPNDAELLQKPLEEGGFGYTDDERYLIRSLFDDIHNLANRASILERGRKLTGLS